MAAVMMPTEHQYTDIPGIRAMKAKALFISALAAAISFGGASAFAQTKPAKPAAPAAASTTVKKHARKHTKKMHKAKATAETPAK